MTVQNTRGSELPYRQLQRRSVISSLVNKFCDLGLEFVKHLGARRYMRFKYRDLRRRGVNMEGVPLYIAPDVFIDSTDYSLISIGHNAVISGAVKILTHDYSVEKAAYACGVIVGREFRRVEPISIGRDAFIGMGVILMPGTSVGDYSIVGAGAVVTRDVPARTVVAGNPARVLCTIEEIWDKSKDRTDVLFYE
jgi:acetyltransferase-like isoleucine patch superfamily enzyme